MIGLFIYSSIALWAQKYKKQMKKESVFRNIPGFL